MTEPRIIHPGPDDHFEPDASFFEPTEADGMLWPNLIASAAPFLVIAGGLAAGLALGALLLIWVA